MAYVESFGRAAETLAKPFAFSAKLGYRGVVTLIDYSQPRNKWVFGICVIGGVWAHRMAEVYAPAIITDLVVEHTIRYLNNRAAGKVLGRFVVAPGVVPTLIPLVSYATAAVFAYGLVLSGNGVCALISCRKRQKGSAEVAPEGSSMV